MDVKKDKKEDSGKKLMSADLGNTAEINLFSDDYLYSFVYKKSERLVSAIYMVTNFVSDNEPLRIRLRKKSLNLLSYIMSLLIGHDVSGSSMNKSHFFVERVISAIAEVTALLQIARNSGYLSEMNFSILRKEFIGLENLLREREEEILAKRGRISGNFFDVSVDRTGKKDASQKGIYAAPSGINGFRRAEDSLKGHRAISLGHKDIIEKMSYKASPQERVSRSSRIDERHGRRKDLILELLKKKTRLTIKDISEVITNCSEKTIQRELLDLVRQNVLKKEGERRWSAYSLA
jgi:hypothetical protein